MCTTCFLFSSETLFADGEGPLTQTQVDSIWRHLPTTGAGWIERGHMFIQQRDGALVYDLGPVESSVRSISKGA